MKNMAFQKVGDYFVLVHNAMAPTDEEWDEYMTQYNYNSVLVVTDGGAPTAAQRQRMKVRVDETKQPGKKDPKCATITASAFVRGVLTALGWFFNNTYAAFPPDRVNDALNYLEVPPKYYLAMKTAVQTLRQELKKAKVTSSVSPASRR